MIVRHTPYKISGRKLRGCLPHFLFPPHFCARTTPFASPLQSTVNGMETRRPVEKRDSAKPPRCHVVSHRLNTHIQNVSNFKCSQKRLQYFVWGFHQRLCGNAVDLQQDVRPFVAGRIMQGRTADFEFFKNARDGAPINLPMFRQISRRRVAEILRGLMSHLEAFEFCSKWNVGIIGSKVKQRKPGASYMALSLYFKRILTHCIAKKLQISH